MALGNLLVSASTHQPPEDNWQESSMEAKPAMLQQQNRRKKKRSATLRVCSSSYGQGEARKSLPGINAKCSTLNRILEAAQRREAEIGTGQLGQADADYLIQPNWSDMFPSRFGLKD